METAEFVVPSVNKTYTAFENRYAEGSLFVVEALRWGDRENHSYVIGVFDNREQAELAGEAEVSWRGNKYEYCISEHKLNFIPKDKLDNHAGCK